MCGIAGIVDLGGAPVEPPLLERMIGAIRHRGPDAVGIRAVGPVGLAHARLAIIDLAGGAQPMSNEDGSLAITFNGEIYNYLELRDELIAKGRRFATRSDTEVILRQYEELGEECTRTFNGQWAFAIWDARKRVLVLSRDRIGVRPIYYSRSGRRFLFASEVKALLADPAVRRAIDLCGLDQAFTFWSTIPPRTFFEGIEELPPGATLTLGEDGEARIRRHFQLDYPAPDFSLDEGAAAERLRELLADAVRLRLRADVPVGAYLSGGLDSSLTTALAKRAGAPVETFSVTFEDPEFDEREHQRAVVRHLCLAAHHSVNCTAEDIGRVFPDVVWHAEQPLVRTAPAPLYLLSREVREHGCKVVVTGEGADEMLGGYDVFKEAKVRRFWARYPESRLRPLLLRRLYPYMSALQAQPDAYLKAFFRVRPEDLANPLFSHLPRWELTARLKQFFSDEVRSALAGRDAQAELAAGLPERFPSWDPFCQAQYLETAFLLPGHILSSQGDRMAMAHGIEGRFPFLDYRVADFASRLPPRFKMRALDEKHLLKRAAGDLVPPSILRRPKQPYRAAAAASFFDAATGRARFSWVEELLSRPALARVGLFRPEAVQVLVDKARHGRATGTKDGMALVAILSTQLAVEQLIEGRGRRNDAGQSPAGGHSR